MSLNNNGIITYEDYVVSENEHDDQDDYTSSDESENEENGDYENEEKKDDYDSDNKYEYNSSEENYESSDSENEEKREIEVSKENEENEEKKDEEINFIEKKSKRQPKIVEECGICAETLNRSNRKEIKCLFCNYVACRSCYEQYLIQSG